MKKCEAPDGATFKEADVDAPLFVSLGGRLICERIIYVARERAPVTGMSCRIMCASTTK
jgi:hypothetical protein